VVVVEAARMYLGFENRVLRYLRDAVYPTYILHQTVVVAIGFFVVDWELGVAGKFAFIVLASLSVTLTLYELVRRVGILRPLFSLKLKGRRRAGAVTGHDPRRG
jgi:glucan biosynthesis protein C